VVRNANFLERLLGAGGVVWFYLYKALLPINLAFVYPQWSIQTGNLLWWLPFLAALIVTAVLWKYREGLGYPILLAWGFFCVALVPVMGFADAYFMKYSLVADHYQHIALIGVISLATAGWSVWHQRARNALHWAATVAFVVTVGILSFLTWRQCSLYHDEIKLYQSVLEINPGCWMVHNNLGIAFEKSGRMQEAVEHYKKALHFMPDFAEAHNNLGIALVRTGQIREAVEHFQKALLSTSNNSEIHYNMGNALVRIGRIREAIEHYEQALRFMPDSPEVLNNLGIALVKIGRISEAIEHYKKAMGLAPDFCITYYNLAVAYARISRPSEAVATAQKALELARSQGQTALAKQIADWLNSYRASLSEVPNTSPQSKSTPPMPSD
jgi:tetratricopeptide (TPR) repeat protein